MQETLHEQYKRTTRSYSYTRISDWKQCPHKFYLKHVKKVTTLPTEALRVGNAAHKGIELYINLFNNLGLAYEDASLREELMRAIVTREPSWMANLNASEYATVSGWLMAFPGKFQLPTDTVPEVSIGMDEDWKPVSTTNWKKCKFRTRIDLLSVGEAGSFLVWDWKTGKAMYEADDEENLQMKIYALSLWKAGYEASRYVCRFCYVKLGRIYETVIPKEEIPGIQDEVESWAVRIEQEGNFPPRPKALWCCKTCEVRSDCISPKA